MARRPRRPAPPIDPRPVRPVARENQPTGGPPIVPWRIYVFYGVILVVFGVLIARLVQLQGVEGAYYLELANENRQQLVNVPAPRGVIYDRRGVLLARNVPALNITITPAYLPDSDAQIEEIGRAHV